MYILWRYDVDWASGLGGDTEHTEGVASENKIVDCIPINLCKIFD